MTAMRRRSQRLSDDDGDGGQSRERGIAWGTEVAQAVLAWRATDGFSASYPPFTGGTATGQWRPTPPAFGPMSAQGLAFTAPFVLVSNTQFEVDAPRGLMSATYTDDFNTVKALGRNTGSTRTAEQTALALFWDGNASVHWNQAANQIARANHLSMSASNRLLAVLNIAMADTAITTWSGKRFYGSVSDRSDLAAGHRDPAGGHRWQSGHGCRSELAAAHHHTLAPGVPGRTSQPERCGGDRAPPPL